MFFDANFVLAKTTPSSDFLEPKSHGGPGPFQQHLWSLLNVNSAGKCVIEFVIPIF